MNKIEIISDFIDNSRLDRQSDIIESLETFISENKILLNSEDYIKLMITSSKLQTLIQSLKNYNIDTKDAFIKKLLGAYNVINSHIDLEDKIILESLRVNFDASLRDVLFKKYSKRIQKMIKSKFSKSQDYQDYLHDGYEILLTCINTFDLNSNYSFIKYVEYKINCDLLGKKEKIEFESLDSVVEKNDIESDLILKDFLARFQSAINSFELSQTAKDIMDLYCLDEEKRNEHLKRLKISKGTAAIALKNVFRKLLRTTLLDEYSDFLDNPSTGKSMLETSRCTKENPANDLRTITNLSIEDFDIYKELQMLGILEEEIDSSLAIMNKADLLNFHNLCGNDLKKPILKETPTPQEIMAFYSSKRTLIKLISRKNNKSNKSQEKTFNIYENMMRKGYSEEDIDVGIQNLSLNDLKTLRQSSMGNPRNSILITPSNEQELKSIESRLEKMLKRNRRFKSRTGILIENARIQNVAIYSEALSVVRSEEYSCLLDDIDETILIIIFLNIGLIKSQKYSVSQIADITGVHMREIRRVILNNLELIKRRLANNKATLKLN